MPLLDLKNIEFRYEKLHAGEGDFCLADINLSINSGEFVTIVGPNGSGKSTLLKLISGILKRDSGELRLNSVDYNQISRKNLARTIAFVPQSAQTIFPFSIYEIVMMGRTPYLNYLGLESRRDKEIVDDALNMVNITHLKHKGINEVSGGEAQRAFIARAIVQEPDIILLDEPNAHLDIRHQLSVLDLIKELNLSRKMTVIAVMHDLNLAGYYSSRIIMMKQGKVFRDDKAGIILTEENIRDVFGVESRVLVDQGTRAINVVIRPANFNL
ncbi:MAG: ABC transporter ATP-binding protein [Syntrophothermus sp.]